VPDWTPEQHEYYWSKASWRKAYEQFEKHSLDKDLWHWYLYFRGVPPIRRNGHGKEKA